MRAIDWMRDAAPEAVSRPGSLGSARASIRVVGGGPSNEDTVVEIVGSLVIHDVFLALRLLGVDIVHARVRADVDGACVQQFHLLEADGRALTRRRLSRVLYRLASMVGVLFPERSRAVPLSGSAAALAAS